MKSLYTALLLSLIMLPQALAAPDWVTVYPNGNAIFHENKNIGLNAGTQDVRLLDDPVARGVMLLPKGETWQNGVSLLGLITPSLYKDTTAQYIEKSVWVRDVVTNAYVQGVLKAVLKNEGQAIVSVPNKGLWKVSTNALVLRNVDNLEAELKTNAHTARFNSPSPTNVKGDLFYQKSGLSSTINYVWKLPQNFNGETPVRINANVTLNNNSNDALENVRVNTLLGVQNRSHAIPTARAYKAMADSMMETAVASPQSEAMGELMMIRLPGKVSLAPKQSIQMLWQQLTPKATQRYIYAPSSGGWWYTQESGRFDTPKSPIDYWLDLGKWGAKLPQGSVQVYQADAKGDLQLINESQQGAHAPNTPFRLHLGQSQDVRASKQQVDYDENKLFTRVSYEVTLENTKDTAVQVDVHETPNGQWKLSKTSEPTITVEGVPFAWRVTLGPKESKTLSYRFTLDR
jgi:hypothetical protein